MSTSLPLHAEYLLLAHDDETGRPPVAGTHLKAGLAGPAISELALQGALRLEGEGRSARLRAVSEATAPELAEALRRADGQSPKNAVARVGGGQSWHDRAGELRDATLAELERSGVGARDEEKVLGVFSRKVWREKDPRVEHEIVERIRAAVHSSEQPDTRTAVLISLLQATGLLHKALPDEDKRPLAARAKEIAEGDWGGEAVRKAIEEVQPAVFVSVIAAGGAATH